MPKHIITISFQAYKPTPNDAQVCKNPHEMDIQRHPTIARNAQTHHHHLRYDLEWDRYSSIYVVKLKFLLHRNSIYVVNLTGLSQYNSICVIKLTILSRSLPLRPLTSLSHTLPLPLAPFVPKLCYAEIESIQMFLNTHLFNLSSDVLYLFCDAN